MNDRRKTTEGKKLGKVSFWISEIIAVFTTIGVVIVSFKSGEINATLIGSLLFFQGTIFTVTWGAKASSNFAKNRHRIDEQDEGI